MANPPARPMPAFLQKMMQANPNIICTAKGAEVKMVCVSELLEQRLQIPVFQRRYTWGRDQWATLLADAWQVAEGKRASHTLGRITCVRSTERLSVIDGQQRNTSCSLLLAAIRDSPCCSEELAERISAVLLPDQAALQDWLQARPDQVVEEGEELAFAALVPTYCDRAAYFAAMLPAGRCEVEWQRPLEAKCFFLERLAGRSQEELGQLAQAVLERFKFLLFPIAVGEHSDGTEDLHIIYERLAQRDATFCKPCRDTEFASMGAADFVRNLLLGSFQSEETAVELYKRHWLPIEQAAAQKAKQSRLSGVAAFLEEMLESFLACQPESSSPLALPSTVGGTLYARFRRWFVAASAEPCCSDLSDGERHALEALRRLQAFALPHLAKRGSKPESKAPSKASCVEASGARWRCGRCSFSNGQSAAACTACLLPRPSVVQSL